MSAVGYFFYLLAESLSRPLVYVSMTISVLLAYWGSSSFQHDEQRAFRLGWFLCAAIPLFLPLAQLLVGVVFFTPENAAWPNGPPPEFFPDVDPQFAEAIVMVLFLAHLPLGLLLWFVFRPRWWFSLIVTLNWMWFSFSTTFMAAQSVTGNWV